MITPIKAPPYYNVTDNTKILQLTLQQPTAAVSIPKVVVYINTFKTKTLELVRYGAGDYGITLPDDTFNNPMSSPMDGGWVPVQIYKNPGEYLAYAYIYGSTIEIFVSDRATNTGTDLFTIGDDLILPVTLIDYPAITELN